MGILILVILIIGIVVFLCKKFNVSKKVITIITVILISIGIIIILLGRFNIINKIMYEIYKFQPTITQEERTQAIAEIHYTNIIGIDAQFFETYYIFKNENNTYYYIKTSSQTTIAGPQEEKINKKGNINNSKQLEKIIDNIEKKIKSKSSTMEYVTISYAGNEIEKNELLNKLFNI